MQDYGFVPADVLIPAHADMTRWACVACDQYTSEPDYWQAVEKLVGDAPSTLHLMLPEIYLSETEERSERIIKNMREYLENGVFRTLDRSFVYVERTLASGGVRRGLVGAIDLEVYDYSRGTQSLCRPTEATVVSRLPARVEIRSKAALEMPHIMMLLDDPRKTVVEQFASRTASLEKVYDFPLMQHSGSIRGWRVSGAEADGALNAVAALCENSADEHPMLYAMGDGNHSLAAAKMYYENLKKEQGEAAKSHPARYALVELVNLHDDSLDFEPIHRVAFGVDPEKLMRELADYCGFTRGRGAAPFKTVVNGKVADCAFNAPSGAVTVGVIQDFLDAYTAKYGGETDYIHGEDVVINLASAPDRVGFIVDGISKDSFFDVIKKDGVLPRKTFSMGHAEDKRFYLECRKIK